MNVPAEPWEANEGRREIGACPALLRDFHSLLVKMRPRLTNPLISEDTRKRLP
jgi:hypothetical protein